jgi:hypothetical protein
MQVKQKKLPCNLLNGYPYPFVKKTRCFTYKDIEKSFDLREEVRCDLGEVSRPL